MKNLNKALALLVVIAMTISSVVFAADFSDVAGDAAYAEAINVGVSLNLFKGYEDGTFKPEGDITRAEFAAIVVRMLGQEAQAAGAAGSTSFTDVAADNWAAGYINIATRLGIINGYGDGKFGPEDKVLYEQAIKMVVVALGYAPSVGSAGYPVGYLTKAGELGITNGLKGENGVAANRGLVARIVFNSIDVPLMQQTGYGTFVDYVIQDGYGDTTRKTILSEYLSVVKLQVNVNDSSVLKSTSKKDETVDVTIKNNYKTKYSTEFATGTDYTIAVGNTNLSSLVGSKAIVYVLYDENSSDDPIAVYASKDTSKTYETTINSELIENAYIDPSDATSIILEYYENESDNKPQKVEIKKASSNLYVNGGASQELLATAIDKGAFYGSITLAKINSDTVQDYDTVYVTDYTDVVVDTVNTNTCRVTAKNDASAIVFDPDNTSITANLYDDKGVKMDWKDLKEWDVISVQIAKGANQSKTVYTARLVKNSITGKITGVKDYAEGREKVKYEISGKDYMIDSKGMALNDLYLGDEGTFYLDQLGRIAWYDTTAQINSNYAYIQNIVAVTGLTSQPEMKVFNAKGEFETYKISETVKIDGVGGLKSKDMFDASEDAQNLTKTMTQTDYNSVVDRYGADNITFNGGTVTVAAVVPGNFITFKTDSKNEVTEIDRATQVANTTNVKGKFTQYGPANQSTTTYTEASQSLSTDSGRVYLTDKTVIMVAPGTNDDDDYELFSVASIEDDQVFSNASFFNVDENKNVGAILVKVSPDIQPSTSGFLAVSGYSETTNTNGDSNYTVEGLKDGVVEKLPTVSSSEITVPSQGQVALVSKNAKGEVKSFDVLADLDTTANTMSAGAKALLANGTANSKNLYYFGKVKEIRGRNVTIFDNNAQSTGTKGFDIATSASTNVYVYDERVSSTRRVSIQDINYIVARLATSKDTGYTEGDTIYEDTGLSIASVSIFAREYEGKVIDVMIYIFK